MRKIREVLRLHCELGCAHRRIAAACSVSLATVSDYLRRALRAGLDWQQAQSLSEAVRAHRAQRASGAQRRGLRVGSP